MLQVLWPGSRKSPRVSIRESKARSTSKSEFHTAARRGASEDSMNKVFLLIVVTAVLGAPGFAQTPEASPTTDQINTPTAAAPAPVATTTTPAQPVVTP